MELYKMIISFLNNKIHIKFTGYSDRFVYTLARKAKMAKRAKQASSSDQKGTGSETSRPARGDSLKGIEGSDGMIGGQSSIFY
jgi:hypothetical protein